MANATVFVQDPALPVHRAAAVGDTLVDGSGNPLGGGVPTTRSVATTAPLTGGGGRAVNTTVTVGGAGQAYGGGGAGSFTATTAEVGGAGANGLLRIWEFA